MTEGFWRAGRDRVWRFLGETPGPLRGTAGR